MNQQSNFIFLLLKKKKGGKDRKGLDLTPSPQPLDQHVELFCLVRSCMFCFICFNFHITKTIFLLFSSLPSP
jgi:hypothetical protein